jgi:hypothetical protein
MPSVDFDGDGDEELAVGGVEGGPGIRGLFRRPRRGPQVKDMVDDGGMDTEDVIVGDFSGDGSRSVASGQAAQNIKIY